MKKESQNKMNLREHHKLQSASDGSVGLMLDSHKHEGLSGHHQPHLKKKTTKTPQI